MDKEPTDRLVLTIGRGDHDMIRVNDDYASSPHAKLTIYPDHTVTIEDCGSTNGTWLDKARVYGPTIAGPHSTIMVGRTQLKVMDLLLAAVRRPW
jgi:pSer/pThr/pTyr-binding forkhead associated (FHA) protein